MTDTDVSFYPTKPPEPFNPLTAMQGYASLQNTMQHNQLLQQQVRGKIATGRILSANQNPDGTTNMNGAMRQIMQDPDARLLGLDTQSQLEHNNTLTGYMGRQNGIPTPMQAPLPNVMGMGNPGQQAPPMDQDHIDELHAHNQALINTLEPLANDPTVDQPKVTRAVVDLVAHPDAKFNATDAATILSQIPHGPGGSPATAQALQPLVQQQLQKQRQYESILSQKYPSTAQLAARRNAAALVAGQGDGGQEGLGDNPQTIPAGNGQTTPGTATGLPVGYTSPQPDSRKNYEEVTEAAKTSGDKNAAINEIINLNKGGTLTGTRLADWYKIAAKNDPFHIMSGAADTAAQTQEMEKWLAQSLLMGGMPSTNEKLQQLQHGNLSMEQLPETIKELAPFFKAVSNSALAKQNYYNRVTNFGNDMAHEPAAKQQWDNNYDPRWIEMDGLPPDQRKDFLKKHPDLLEKRHNYQTLQNMGVVKGF